MRYADLRDFVAQLEKLGELRRIRTEVSPNLEMTEICDRVLRAGVEGSDEIAGQLGDAAGHRYVQL